jgi:3-hydroxyacyl-CoA dehydrogenase
VSLVNYRREERIAVIAADAAAAPLTAALLEELLSALASAAADAGVVAVVLDGAFGTPGEGEEGGPRFAAALERTATAIAGSARPVLALLDGHIAGPGLDLALACRWRIGTGACSLGFPQVKLGLMPPAATLARLTRLTADPAVLDALLTGSPLSGQQGLEAGVLDARTAAPPDAGIGFVRAAIAGGVQARPVPAPPPARCFADLRAKAAKARGQLAPLRIVDAIEGLYTRPPEQALQQAQAYHTECRDSGQHQALLHLADAQRAARAIPGLPADAAALPIHTAAVIGAGTMGGGIAMTFANAGIPVTILELTAAALERGLAVIRRNYEGSVTRGTLTPQQAQAALGLIRGATDYAALSRADIIIEAVFEELNIKREVFAALDRVAAPRAILATNTSSLDIDAIAASTSRPQQVVGTHFFSPANIMKLLENVRGKATSAQVIRTVMDLGQTLGKVTVLAGNADGFIGNRMLMFYGLEAEFLLEEGATPAQIDRVIEAFGFAMGPLAVRDLAGNDVGLQIRRSRTLPADERWSPVLERMVAAGRLGQKAGRGFYRYEGRTRVPDPAAVAIIEEVSRELGVVRRQIPDAEILDRLLHPLVNAGAQLVEQGIALRTGDVDIVYVNGYGFPAWRGGPMYWAQHSGLGRVVSTMQQLAVTHGRRWGPAPLLERAAARGSWE